MQAKLSAGTCFVFLLVLALSSPAVAVEVGDNAPDFELPGTTGGNFKLSGQLGKNVLIQFYVLDFTPG
jgi:hypothetical protein